MKCRKTRLVDKNKYVSSETMTEHDGKYTPHCSTKVKPELKWARETIGWRGAETNRKYSDLWEPWEKSSRWMLLALPAD